MSRLPRNAKAKDVVDVVGAVMNGRKRATVFLAPLKSPKHRITATQHGRSNHIVLTIGPLNAGQRRHVKQCQLAGVATRRFWFGS